MKGEGFKSHHFNFDDSAVGVPMGMLTSTSKEVDFFNHFWDDVVMGAIVDKSNKFFHFMLGWIVIPEYLRDRQWVDAAMPEIRILLVLSILLGILRKRS